MVRSIDGIQTSREVQLLAKTKTSISVRPTPDLPSLSHLNLKEVLESGIQKTTMDTMPDDQLASWTMR